VKKVQGAKTRSLLIIEVDEVDGEHVLWLTKLFACERPHFRQTE